jgi:hypothetical protein
MKPLEPGQLWLMRIRAAIFAIIVLLAAVAGEEALRQKVELPRGAIALPLLVALAYLVLVTPGRRYRAWSYGMDGEELHVRRGVLTRVQTVVPLDRIQHIDISQGPLERGFAVCRLLVHTAGTLHSQVLIPGLARETAETMRDEIRARIREEPE